MTLLASPLLATLADCGNQTQVPSGDRPARGPSPLGTQRLPAEPPTHTGLRMCSILLVDDEAPIRRICALALAGPGVIVHEADNGVDAVTRIAAHPYDLVLLDMELPRLAGESVLRQALEVRAAAHMKVMVLSGQGGPDHLATLLAVGADDFILKPFTVPHLRARATALLRLKAAQDRADDLAGQLSESNVELERALMAKSGELMHARSALVLALARLVEARSSETGPHLMRLQKYARILGEAAAARPRFAGRLTDDFLRTVEAAAPLHDIGKVAVPDHVLNKPGRLTDDERKQMQTHAAAGADTLESVTAEFPFAVSFFRTAIEIARHHHERWDGKGYPDQLAGEAIPLSARVVAIGDVYDALRSSRVYKPPMTHAEAVATMTAQGGGHFDPDLFDVFLSVTDRFDEVYAATIG